MMCTRQCRRRWVHETEVNERYLTVRCDVTPERGL